MDNYAIVFENVIKYFDDQKKCPALNNLSFKIPKNKITGLIGADGSGKSTLIKCAIGLLSQNSGFIKTLDLNPNKEIAKIKQNIGYMPQNFGLYEDLTVIENLNLFTQLKETKNTDEIEELLNFTGLKEFKKRLASDLSGGMKQKLGLACTIIGSPNLLLLDEPSVGVDPLSRRDLFKMVKQLTNKNTTILWATSYLDEASYFENVIILDQGKLIFEGVPNKITNKVENRVFNLCLDEKLNKTEYINIIKNKSESISDITLENTNIRLVLKDKNFSVFKEYNIVPTKPRFEDGVIDLMGGIVFQESEIVKNYKIPDINIEYPIVAQSLEKKYNNFVAVKNNSFKIKKGEIFGLLGPNGAGKSTSFKMICSLTKPTSGYAEIMGINVNENPSKARKYIGYMSQKFSLYKNLTLLQNLEFFSSVYGLFGKIKTEKINEMIEIFKFEKYINIYTNELPLGVKQKLSLVKSIIHSPNCLFLDEPTSGVDPLARREFWNHIIGLSNIGVTVMVTTHFMDEAQYCDRISLFYKGESILTGKPNDLIKPFGKDANMDQAFIKTIEKYQKM